MKIRTALCACFALSTSPAWAQDGSTQASQQTGQQTAQQRADETTRIATEVADRVAKQFAAQIAAEVAKQIAAHDARQAAERAGTQAPASDATLSQRPETGANQAAARMPAQAAAQPSTQVASGETDDDAAPIPQKRIQGKYHSHFYGSLDLGVEHLNNEVTGARTYGSNRVSAGTATPYFGYIYYQPLRANMVGVVNLEGGFTGDSGISSLGTRLFGRQSYVGVIGDYGSLTFGRQYTMRFWAVQVLNPLGVGSQGLPTLDNGISNARADNAVSYRVQRGKWDVGVNYSFGRDAVSSSSAVGTNCAGETDPGTQCRERSVLLKYGDRHWGIASAYEQNQGGTDATFGKLTSPDKKDSRTILGAYYRTEHNVLGTVGWIRRDAATYAPTPVSNLVWLGTSAPITKYLVFDGMLARIKYEDSSNGATMLAMRGVYALDEDDKMAAYVTADYVRNGGVSTFGATTSAPVVNPKPGGSQLSIITGVRLKF